MHTATDSLAHFLTSNPRHYGKKETIKVMKQLFQVDIGCHTDKVK
jgi:hypothetical protein